MKISHIIITLLLTLATTASSQKNAARFANLSNLDTRFQVEFESQNNVLLLFVEKALNNTTITILSADDKLIFREAKFNTKRHTLLEINKSVKKGVYYVYLEEPNKSILIEEFEILNPQKIESLNILSKNKS